METPPTVPQPEIDYDLAALLMENRRLRDGLNRQALFIEAMDKYSSEVRVKAWSSQEDMHKAEAVLYEALRSVLLPRDANKPSKPFKA